MTFSLWIVLQRRPEARHMLEAMEVVREKMTTSRLNGNNEVGYVPFASTLSRILTR